MEIERRVCEAARAILCVSDRERSRGSNASNDAGMASARQPTIPLHENLRPRAQLNPPPCLRAAVDRVVITRTTIEIELTEGIPGESGSHPDDSLDAAIALSTP